MSESLSAKMLREFLIGADCVELMVKEWTTSSIDAISIHLENEGVRQSALWILMHNDAKNVAFRTMALKSVPQMTAADRLAVEGFMKKLIGTLDTVRG